MKIAILTILATAVLAVGVIWYRNQQSLEAMRRHQAAYEARTSYSASSFPVTVTFPRGGVMPVDYWGEMRWKDRSIEIAVCSGFTEEHLYAEFHTAPAAFADADHPLVKIHLGILFGKPFIPGNEAFHVLRDEAAGANGWRIRQSIVASPHGALAHPPEIGEAAIARWPVAPGYVHKPFQMPGPDILPPTPQMSNYQKQRIQRKQEYKAGQENLVNEERKKKHHHFAMVEAIKDFGEGRSVVIRKVGQYFSPKAMEGADQEVRAMTGKVKQGT